MKNSTTIDKMITKKMKNRENVKLPSNANVSVKRRFCHDFQR